MFAKKWRNWTYFPTLTESVTLKQSITNQIKYRNDWIQKLIEIRNVICDCSSMFLSRVVEVGFPSSKNALSVEEFRCGAIFQSWFLGCNCLLISCSYHCYGTVSFIKNLALKHLKSVNSCFHFECIHSDISLGFLILCWVDSSERGYVKEYERGLLE